MKINCQDIEDKDYINRILADSEKIKDKADSMESQILEIIENKISGGNQNT